MPHNKYKKQIIDFISNVYGNKNPLTNEKLFEWFYSTSNQYSSSFNEKDRLTIILAIENNQIVSILGFYKVTFLVNSDSIPGIWLARWYTLPDYRKGIGALLMKELVDRENIICGLGLSSMNIPICKALKFNIIDRVNTYIAILQSKNYDTILFQKKSNKKILNRTKIKINSTKLTSSHSFNCKHKSIKSLNHGGIHRESIIETYKDQKYLDWKYNYHPFLNYSWSYIVSNNILIGWLIWRIKKIENFKLCRVVDFDIINYKENDLIEELLLELVNTSIKNNCNYIEISTRNIALERVLNKCGFEENQSYGFPNHIDPVSPNRLTLNAEYYCSPNLSYDKKILYLNRGDGDEERPNESIWN